MGVELVSTVRVGFCELIRQRHNKESVDIKNRAFGINP